MIAQALLGLALGLWWGYLVAWWGRTPSEFGPGWPATLPPRDRWVAWPGDVEGGA